MRRTFQVATGTVVLALAVVLACGEVPTLVQGIAYITPIQTPSPSVASGDTLRDSLGRAAPLRVFAIGRDSADTIRTISLRFLVTTLGTGATIDNAGYLVASDSLQTLRIVAQVTDAGGNSGLKLQTTEFTLEVVPRADSIVGRPAAADTGFKALPFVTPLPVTVTGVGPKGIRGTVNGIIVHYRIATVFPAGISAEHRYYLSDNAGGVLRRDSTIALDTTKSGGVASRSFVGLHAPAGAADADSVVVEAAARSQNGVPLSPSPVRFTVKIKKS